MSVSDSHRSSKSIEIFECAFMHYHFRATDQVLTHSTIRGRGTRCTVTESAHGRRHAPDALDATLVAAHTVGRAASARPRNIPGDSPSDSESNGTSGDFKRKFFFKTLKNFGAATAATPFSEVVSISILKIEKIPPRPVLEWKNYISRISQNARYKQNLQCLSV